MASALSSFAARAPAQEAPVPVELRYTAPPECPRAAQLRARVSALTPRVHWVETEQASRQLSIQLALDARGARGALTLRSAAQKPLVRRLQAASCAEAAEAMAIIVALIFDPEAKLSPPPAPATAKPAAPAPPPVAPPRRRSLRASVTPELFVVGGPTPSPTLGGALGVAVLFLEQSPWQLGVRAAARSSLSEDLSTQYGTASFAWRALSLELCPLGSSSRRRWRAEGCITFDAGQIVASADSNPGSQSQRTWLAPGGALHLGVSTWDFLTLDATLAASAPLLRDRFLLTPFAIHQPASLAWRAGLALSFRFY